MQRMRGNSVVICLLFVVITIVMVVSEVAAVAPPSVSVWEIAVQDVRRRPSSGKHGEVAGKSAREATLLVIGTASSGKTTLLHKFLDREEPTKPTLALEYTYGRRSNKTLMEKDVCHLWELGGGTIFSSLLATPLNANALARLTVILMLDLSRPQTIWSDMETLLEASKKEIENALKTAGEEGQKVRETLTKAASLRIGLDHVDKSAITPFVVPLVILGGKCDLFQDLEPESKKVICRSLRFVAHTNGATLQFFSAKDAGLIKRGKTILSHYGFSTEEGKSLDQDYNKPLVIPAGSDSLSLISGQLDQESASNMTYDAWKHFYTARFPQEHGDKKSVLPEDPCKDPNFKEPDVDNLRVQKDQELDRIRREVGQGDSRWMEMERLIV